MLALALVLIGQVAPSDAIDRDLNIEKVFAKEEQPTPDGWKFNLTVGVNGSMTHSSNVVGMVNGTSAQAGAVIDGGATLKFGLNSWENAVRLNEAFTRTPTVPTFLKSADELRLQSTFLHRMEAVQWLGPYARFFGSTSIFRGWTVPATDVYIERIGVDGNSTTTQKLAGQKYGLTKPFEPLVLRESAGFFANPIEGTPITMRTRLGAAAQQLIAQQGYALKDATTTTPNNPATPIVYQQLRSSVQGGAEFDVEALGTIVENVTYSGRADFFYPIWETNDSQVKGSKLQTDISAKLSVRLSKYLSLDYILSAKKIPQVVDVWQVQNGLLLSIAFTVI